MLKINKRGVKEIRKRKCPKTYIETLPIIGGRNRIRTGVDGFADRCLSLSAIRPNLRTANLTNSRAFTNKLQRFWVVYFLASSVTLTRFTSPSIGAACFTTTTLEDSTEQKSSIRRLIILCATCSISLDLIAISS